MHRHGHRVPEPNPVRHEGKASWGDCSCRLYHCQYDTPRKSVVIDTSYFPQQYKLCYFWQMLQNHFCFQTTSSLLYWICGHRHHTKVSNQFSYPHQFCPPTKGFYWTNTRIAISTVQEAMTTHLGVTLRLGNYGFITRVSWIPQYELYLENVPTKWKMLKNPSLLCYVCCCPWMS